MARFEKTQVEVVSAVLFLLGLYALAGLAYAAWMHSDESIVTWAIVAAFGFVGSIAYHRLITKKKRGTP